MTSLTVTIEVAGSHVGGAILPIKLTPEQVARGHVLVWIDGEATLVSLHQLHRKASRGAQHARKERG